MTFRTLLTYFSFTLLVCWVVMSLGYVEHKVTNELILRRSHRLRHVSTSACRTVSGRSRALSHCFSLCIARFDYFHSFSHNAVTKECKCCDQPPPASAEVTDEEGWRTYSVECSVEGNWTEFEGHYYSYREENVTWFQARVECQKSCSYLVEVGSEAETDWLAETFLKTDQCQPNVYITCTSWTGGNDLGTEGRYVWDYSNTKFNYTKWLPNEPSGDTEKSARDCVDMFWSGHWNDRPCEHQSPFICERSQRPSL